MRSLFRVMVGALALLMAAGLSARAESKSANWGFERLQAVGAVEPTRVSAHAHWGNCGPVYESESGVSIWLSPDPDWLKQGPMGLNPYQYAYWNPIKFVDPDGRWPHVSIGPIRAVHQEETRKALKGVAPARQLRIMTDQAVIMDRRPEFAGDGAHPANYPKHGQTPPGTSKENAIAQSETWIKSQMEAARTSYSQGSAEGKDAAAAATGRAAHTVQDILSPAHGFSNGDPSPSTDADHLRREADCQPAVCAEVRDVTRALWEIQTGERPMPAQFLDPKTGAPTFHKNQTPAPTPAVPAPSNPNEKAP